MIVLAAAAAGYYWYTHRHPGVSANVVAGTWRRVTPSDGERGARSVATLQSSSGKVFVNLSATEAVGYLLQSVSKQLPPSAENVEAMILGNTLNVRAVIPLRELGADKVLGPFATFLETRDTVQLGGTIEVIRPGFAQLHVTRVTIHELTLPTPMIPKLLQYLHRQQPAGTASDALAIPLPSYISDVRVGNGKVTLYKNV